MNNKGLTLTELLVALGVIALLMLILLPALARMRYNRYRAACVNNLSQIAKAMHFYINDYNDELPCAGGPNAAWGPTPNWQADTMADAYGLGTEKTAGQAGISASLYLLVKYEQVTPKSFICKGDPKTTEFVPAKYGVSDKELIDLWDFGPNPSKHCSYSYHIPYGLYALTSSNLPGMAVMADRNPWQDAPSYSARPPRDFVSFDPNGPEKLVRRGNAIPHQGNGQNVLFIDGHVAFEKNSACGVNNDNIYTSQNGSDIRKGTRPTLNSQPANRIDSLLVHDPPAVDRK